MRIRYNASLGGAFGKGAMAGRLRIAAVAAVLALALTGAASAETRGLTIRLKASDAAGAADAGAMRLYGASHALVIGIDAYTAGWPRLRMAVADARAVAAALRRKGFEVTLRTDLDSEALRRTLREFFAIKGADPEARLLLWYAGHGHTIDGEGYLVPADAPPATGPRFLVKALHMRDFGGLMRVARSKHVFAVFDSCFSGTIFTARSGAAPAAITRKTTLPVRQFLTSGDAGQQVRDDGSFRELFIRALSGEERADFNGDGYVTGEEIGLYLSQRMASLTDAAQTPRYGKIQDVKYDRGDFVFELAAGATRRPRAATVAPRLRVEEIDEERVAVKNANVRAGPTAKTAKVGLLERGTAVQVTGRLEDRDWFRVTLADGTEGYVFGKLLGEIPAGSPREGQPQAAVRVPAPPTPPKVAEAPQVALPSGLRLSDWVLLAEDRLKAGELRALLVEGAGHRRAYGRFAGVERVIGEAVAGLLKDAKATDAAAARETLRLVTQVKGVVGDTPRLAALEARSRHRLEQFDEAVAAYKRWLGSAPADHPQRKQMALGLFKAQRRQPFGPRHGDVFRDCDECPEMVVMLAGTFTMGSPPSEMGRDDGEGPQHQVTIPRPFAVGKYEVTFAEWGACVAAGGCNSHRPDDEGWGRGNRPVIYVNWEDAKAYVA